jgi:hypothetical protein
MESAFCLNKTRLTVVGGIALGYHGNCFYYYSYNRLFCNRWTLINHLERPRWHFVFTCGNRNLFCLLVSNNCTDSATAFKCLQACRDWWVCPIILPLYSLNHYNCNNEFEITHWICLLFSQRYNFRWDKQIIRIHHCSQKSLFMSLSFFLIVFLHNWLTQLWRHWNTCPPSSPSHVWTPNVHIFC